MGGRIECETRRATLAGLFGLALLPSSLLEAQEEREGDERKGKARTQGPAPDAEPRISLHTRVVSLEVSVMDSRGRFISWLQKEDFRLYDDGVRQEITYFSRTDSPATVGIVFDLSGSMSEGRIERAREALGHLIETAHNDDEFFLVGCGARPSLLVDRTRDGEAILRRIAPLKASGNTALYDAIALALDKAMKGRHRRRALLIISDGEENHSRISLKDLRRRLHEADVSAWTVLTGPLKPRGRGGAIMEEIASTSGGRSFFPRDEEKMGEAFAQIALELRNRYSLGYTPSNFAADGRWHRIKVTVDSPALTERPRVRAREGYYAPQDRPTA